MSNQSSHQQQQQQQPVYYLDYKEFTNRYKFIRKSKDNTLGDALLFKDIVQHKTVVVKENIISTPDEFDNEIKDYEILYKLNEIPYIIKFLAYTFKLNQGINNTNNKTWTFYSIREYIENDLDREINAKLRDKDVFSEEEIWRLAYQTISTLSRLQCYNLTSQDIRPKTIMNSKEGDYKLYFYFKQIPSYHHILRGLNTPITGAESRFYISPELLIGLYERNHTPEYNKILSGVFSLGMTLLSTCTLNDIDDCYNWDELTLDISKLSLKLNWVRNVYSEKLYKLLDKMLRIEYDKRADFWKLDEYVSSIIASHHNYYGLFINHNNANGNMLNYINHQNANLIQALKRKTSSNTEGNLIIPNVGSITPKRAKIVSRDSSNRTKKHPLSQGVYHGSSLSSTNVGNRKYLNDHQNNCTEPIQPSLIFESYQIVNQPFTHKTNSSNNVPGNLSSKTNTKTNQIQETTKTNGSDQIPLQTSPQKSPKTFRDLSKSTKNEHKLPADFPPNSVVLKELEQNILYDPFTGQQKPSIKVKYYSDGSRYEGQMKGKHRDGRGIYYYKNNDIYAGEWSNDKFHGQGCYLFANDERYEGELVRGYKCGIGTYYYANYNKYIGEWKGDKKNGKGTFYFYSTTEKYEGDWVDGEMHGIGTFYFKTGDKYVGNWVHGEKSGKGIIIYANGTQFNGEWKANKPNGLGHMKYNNGEEYNGEWVNGLKNGSGVYSYSDGSKYEGEWMNDDREGIGTFYHSKGDKYIGGWKNGLKHGKGVYHYKDGGLYEGEWLNDLKNGFGILILANGKKYEGNWLNGEMNGHGVVKFPNGDIYEGDFYKDMMHGKGVYKWANGDIYNGNWSHNLMHGEGRFYHKNGEIHEGIWANQKLVTLKSSSMVNNVNNASSRNSTNTTYDQQQNIYQGIQQQNQEYLRSFE